MNHQCRPMPTVFSCLIAMFFVCNSCWAQSTVIQVGESFERAIQVPQTNFGQIPNSLNSQQRGWLAKLSKSYPGHFLGVENAEDLIVKLRELGLPFELDQSAMDDSFSYDDLLDIQQPSLPLKELLFSSLNSVNATICMKGNRLLIISKDVAGDPQFFTTVTYDVSSLNGDLVELSDIVRSTIGPDDWDDTNGDGALMNSYQGNRKYMSISQAFEIHDSIQQFLAGRLRLQGQSNMIAGDQNGSALRESQVISMLSPYELRNRGTGREKVGGFGGGGGGIGGYGLGGGVF